MTLAEIAKILQKVDEVDLSKLKISDLSKILSSIKKLQETLSPTSKKASDMEAKIKGNLLSALHKEGVKSITSHGLRITIVNRDVYSTANPEELWLWVGEESDRYKILGSKISSTYLKEMEEASEELPPGIEKKRIASLNVKKQ